MQVWIGLVGIGSLPGSTTLGDAKGAYVNAVALAADPQEYQKAVSSALADLGLFAFEFEDVERFSERAAHRQLDEQLHELADEASRTNKVCFADFHTYAALDG
jgi:hypothetical protein